MHTALFTSAGLLAGSIRHLNFPGRPPTLNNSISPQSAIGLDKSMARSTFTDLLDRLCFYSFLGIAVGPVFLAMSGQLFVRSIESYSWPKVDAKIVGHKVNSGRDGLFVTIHYGRAQYVYEVDRVIYECDLTDFYNEGRGNQAMAAADVEKYHIGSIVPAYYNPADPAIAVLRPGTSRHVATIFMLGVALTLLGIVASIYFFRDWLSVRRKIPPKILAKFD